MESKAQKVQRGWLASGVGGLGAAAFHLGYQHDRPCLETKMNAS